MQVSYDRYPTLLLDATRLRRVTYDTFLQERFGVMDATAIALCRDNNLPVRVFALGERGNISRVVKGDDVGTLVSSGA